MITSRLTRKGEKGMMNIEQVQQAKHEDELNLILKSTHSMLSAEEEAKLVKEARHGNVAAEEKLVIDNFDVMTRLAMLYSSGDKDLSDDLFQEAYLGLRDAINKYDPAYGARLTTFAYKKMQYSMIAYKQMNGRSIRLPAEVGKNLKKVERARNIMTNELGRKPSDLEISERTGFSVKELHELAQYHSLTDTVSLDAPLDNEDECEALHAVVRDEHALDPQRVNEESEMWEKCENAISESLSEFAATVIRMRYGIGFDKRWKQVDIAEKLGKSNAYICKVEKEALRKLALEMRSWK